MPSSSLADNARKRKKIRGSLRKAESLYDQLTDLMEKQDEEGTFETANSGHAIKQIEKKQLAKGARTSFIVLFF